ncbi:MAG: VTT domain-containing protein [Nitrospirales bacterium]
MLNVISRAGLSRTAAVLAITAVWLSAFSVLLFNSNLREDLHAFLLHYPELAPLLLVLCQVALATFVLPCSPLTVLAGLLWGFDAAIIYSFIATITGSLWTFALSRWVLKRWVSPEWFSPQMTRGGVKQINELITRYTWRASAIAHANPAFPGSSLGYAFGMTNVSLLSYTSGAVIGVLPLQLVLVALGHVLGQSETISMIHITVMLGSLLFFLILYRLWVPLICGFDSDRSPNHK